MATTYDNQKSSKDLYDLTNNIF